MSITATSVGLGGAGNLAYITEGPLKRTVTDITADNAYPTGGYALTPANLGLSQFATHGIANVTTPSSATTDFAQVHLDTSTRTAPKLKFIDQTTAEVANGGDLTAAVVRVTAWGI